MIEQPIRVLQILDCTGVGSGIANVVLNWHRNIDRDQIQFDYLIFRETKANFQEEIVKLGANVYVLPYPSLLKPWEFLVAVWRFFKEHRYKIVHSHLTQINFFYFPTAKIFGVEKIILHSHNNKYSDSKIKSLINRLMLFPVRIFVNKKLAISDIAGNFLFGKSEYTIINNGINIEKFLFNSALRCKVRKELNIENNFVIGHVGRFVKQKNHSFLIDIFAKIHEQNKNAVLLLIGNGPLENSIHEKVNRLKLAEFVKFLGVRKDIADLYQSIDAFVLPSLYEGFGLVAIEAQVSGVPCFLSSGLPKSVNVVNTTTISLKENAEYWAGMIVKVKSNDRLLDSVYFEDFRIQNIAKKINDMYLTL